MWSFWGFFLLLAAKGHLVRCQDTYEGWLKASNGFSYQFFHQATSWNEAAKNCESKNARLASTGFQDPDVKSTIVELIENNTQHLTWIGLRRAGRNSNWTWSDGATFQNNVTTWATSEPNNFVGSEMCVMIYSSGFLNDAVCRQKMQYLCEASFEGYGEKILELSEEEANPTNVKSISANIDELLDAPEAFFEDHAAFSSNILDSFNHFLSKYNVSKEGACKTEDSNIAISLLGPTSNESFEFGDEYAPGLLHPLRLSLTPEVISETGGGDDVQVAAVLYRKAGLFQINGSNYNFTINQTGSVTKPYRSKSLTVSSFGEEPELELVPELLSEIVKVNILNVAVEGLKSPVRFMGTIGNISEQTTVLPRIKDKRAVQKKVCAFWDPNLHDWSTNGCESFETKNEGESSITCECDHMTAFAVVLQTSYVYSPEYMSLSTRILSALSTTCLLVTALTILLFRKLRQQGDKQLVLHLCLSLIALNVIFTIGIDRMEGSQTETDAEYRQCMAAAVALHYFLLTAWLWMLMEAILLFASVALPFYSRSLRDKMVWIAMPTVYGVPGLVVGLLAGLSGNYLSERYCWLTSDILRYSVWIPVGIILMINLLVVVMVPFFVSCGSEIARKQTAAFCARGGCSRVCCFKIYQNIRRTVSMVFLLGVPWLFGVLMLLAQDEALKNAFAWCFTVCNTAQGILIFLFFCVVQENVREMWKRAFQTRFVSPLQRALSRWRRRKDTGRESISMEVPSSTKTTSLGPLLQNEPEGTQNERMPFRSRWITTFPAS